MKNQETRITVFDYTQDNFKELQVKTAEECIQVTKKKKTVTWINVDGLKDVKLLEELCSKFELHPLVVEDILDTSQRPKLEDYGSYIYIVARMMDLNGKRLDTEQVSIVLGPNFVISFQEKTGDIFEKIRDRIRKSKGKIRKTGPDFLTYSLLDSIVDNYFVILERIGEDVEAIEVELISSTSPKTLHKIHKLKKQMMLLRKSVWPMR